MIPIDKRYCDKHIRESARRHKTYDTYRRDESASAFYKSSAWVHMQGYIINLYNGIDIYSYYHNGIIETATTVHHINELKDCWERRLDIMNLMPVTSTNHTKIHALYKRDKAYTMRLLLSYLNKFRAEYSIEPSTSRETG